jgi:hypothetical protein
MVSVSLVKIVHNSAEEPHHFYAALGGNNYAAPAPIPTYL